MKKFSAKREAWLLIAANMEDIVEAIGMEDDSKWNEEQKEKIKKSLDDIQSNIWAKHSLTKR